MLDEALDQNEELLEQVESQINNLPELPTEDWVAEKVDGLFSTHVDDAINDLFSGVFDQFESLKGEVEAALDNAASTLDKNINIQSPLDKLDRAGSVIQCASEDLAEIADASLDYTKKLHSRSQEVLDNGINLVKKVTEEGKEAITNATTGIQHLGDLDEVLSNSLTEDAFPEVLAGVHENVVAPLNEVLSQTKATHQMIDDFNSEGSEKIEDVLSNVENLTSKLKDVVSILQEIEPFLG